jgi:putative hydroxymethylpyrimidine transport system substrate-binding protein
MNRPARTLAALAAAALAAVSLAACGEKTEPATSGAPNRLEPFTVVLDYFPNADHASIYAAQASGEFRRAGLDVKIVTPPDPSAPLKLLEAGRADLAITYEPELLLARDKLVNLISVGALVQKPLTTLMAIGGSGVRDVSDLRGKTVGTAGIPYQAAYLKTILDKAGVPAGSVKRIDVGFNLVPAMLSKRVDATLGAFWNYEGVDLRQRGKKPVILRMEKLGVPTYDELVFAARRKSLRPAEASRIRRFLQAVARGTRQVQEDPSAALDALLRANRELEPKLQRAAIEATSPVLMPDDASRPFGWQNPDEWHAYGEWMYENGLLKRQPRAEDAMTNEFLPGEGVPQVGPGD